MVEEEYEVFHFPIKKQPKVIRRKLGKHKAFAQYISEGIIEIDSSFKGKKELILYLHEYFHFLFPEMSEEKVIENSEMTADFLWKQHYRKVDNNE
jgi:hypothetical protein